MTKEKKTSKINSNLYLTDSKGDYILNKDGTPRKKGGRPKGSKSTYNYSTPVSYTHLTLPTILLV